MSDTVIEGGLVTLTVSMDGQTIPNHIHVISAYIKKEVNKISTARLRLVDGGFTSLKDDFAVSDSNTFDPGKTIEIKAGYSSKETSIYKGMIVKKGLRLSSDHCEMIIECKEEAAKMTIVRNNEFYIDKKDSEIISELVKRNGLQVSAEATTVQHNEVVQYYATDWDFMLLRADLNGQVVVTDGKKINIGKPNTDGEPVVYVENGVSIISFSADVDSRFQFDKVSGVGWDIPNQKIVKSNSKQVSDLKIGMKSSKLSQVHGESEYHLQSPANLPSNLLEAWASGKLTRSRLSQVQGKVKFQGSAKVKPDVLITLKGLSKSFNGDAYVSAVEHVIEGGDWTTEAQLGLPFKSYAEEMPDIEAPSASGMLPGIKGLQTAIVMKIDEDKDGQHRVQVSYPTLEKDNMGVWARLSSFYATKDSGAFFIPEVGDEVIIGFINEDPQQPIILGSVSSSKQTPPLTADKDNKIKALVTKSKMKLSFDEEKKIITIETPGKNIIVMDDDQKSITLTDMNNNKVEMTKDGMTFTCAKDFTVKSDGKIVLEAKQDVEVKATGSFKGKGMSVEMKGDTKFAAEGAQVEVKGSAQTTIKGGMVMIN
jgi:Rhs element Vgr protein